LGVGQGSLIDLAPAVGPADAPAPRAWYRQLTWHSWLLLTWFLIVSIQLVRLQRQRLRLNRLLREATPAADDRLLAEVKDLSRRIGPGLPRSCS
jgi:hypothetical protein